MAKIVIRLVPTVLNGLPFNTIENMARHIKNSVIWEGGRIVNDSFGNGFYIIFADSITRVKDFLTRGSQLNVG